MARLFGDIPANDNIDAVDVLYGGSATPGLENATDVEGAIDELHSQLEVLHNDSHGGISELLRAWNAAVANSDGEPAKIVYVGDSITETEAWWLEHFKELISSASEPIGHEASRWLNIQDVLTAWDTVGGTLDTDYGLSGWARSHAASTGEESSHSEYCDAIDVYYTKQASGGSDLLIYLDGVLQTTIDTTDNAATPVTESGQVWSSGSLSHGSHTIRVVASGSGTAIVDGAMFHRGGSAGQGIQHFNAAHNGWTTTSFHDHEGLLDSVTSIDPHLVVVFLGTNDYGDLELFSTNYDTLLDSLASAAPNADFLLICPYASLNRTDTGWSTYRDVIHDEAETRGYEFLDLFLAMGDVGSNYDIHGFSIDGVHPTSVGARVIAAAVYDKLMIHGAHGVPILHDGSRSFYGDINGHDSVGRAKWTLGSFFLSPFLSLYMENDDLYPSLYLGGGNTAGSLLPTLAMGAGDSDNVDIVLQRSGVSLLDVNSTRFENAADPVSAQDLATKAYVDAYGFNEESIDDLNIGSSLSSDSYLAVLTYGATPTLEKFTVGDLHLRDVSAETSTSVELTDSNYCVLVDSTAGDVTVTLPVSVSGLEFVIKKMVAANQVIVEGDGATPATIDGASNATLSGQYDSITLIGDGADWHII